MEWFESLVKLGVLIEGGFELRCYFPREVIMVTFSIHFEA